MGCIRRFFVSFIPKYVSNRFFLNVYQMLSTIKVPRMVREKNYKLNLEQLCGMNSGLWNSPSVYIENQNEWKNIWFGAGRHHNMSYSGCEIIASFNACKALRGFASPEQMAQLIYDYEMHGAALLGEFGTSPRAIEKYFRHKGFTVSTAYGEDFAEVDRIASSYQVMIATVYNDKDDITKQVHTVCITVVTGTRYVLHNAYLVNKEGTYVESVPYKTVTDAVRHISRYEPKLIYLIGID
ncbi:MAG: hypothetical protein K2L82_04425 [Lachnospiraceae bacterium]|nr:hypothetical protein [Lachnospiraceae bacterium]